MSDKIVRFTCRGYEKAAEQKGHPRREHTGGCGDMAVPTTQAWVVDLGVDVPTTMMLVCPRCGTPAAYPVTAETTSFVLERGARFSTVDPAAHHPSKGGA